MLIVPLDAESATHRRRAGGKAAALAALMRRGFPIPAGFVVTTDAYRAFTQTSGIAERLSAVLARVDAVRGEADLRPASRELGQIIASAPLDGRLHDALLRGVRSLRTSHVAVRSSAVHEDGATHSWAGQLETELNVDANDVAATVKRCWASLFSPRALAYRAACGAPSEPPLIAVLVQKMIPAARAGVAFSVDPVTGDDAIIVIEAAHGLGEVVVQGATTPERHVLAKRTLASLARTEHRQTRTLVPRATGAGTRWMRLPANKRGQAIVRPAEARVIAGLVNEAEGAFAAPVDVEWAATTRAVYVLQCRAVTALTQPEPFDPAQVRWRFVHSRRRSPFFKSCFFAPMSDLEQDLGLDYRMCPAGIVRDSVVVAEDAWRRLAARLADRWTSDPRWCLRTMSTVHEAHRAALHRWRKLPKTSWQDIDRNGLATAIARYVASLGVFAPHVGWVAIGEEEMSTRVREGLVRRFGADAAVDAYAIAVDPIDVGTVHTERCALMKIAARYARGRDVRGALAAHAARFGWMKNVGYFGEYYDVEHYAREAERMSREDADDALVRIETEERTKRSRFRKLLRDVAGDAALANAIRTANAAVTFRSYRTEIFYQSHVYVRALLAAAADRLGVSAEQILFLLPDEIIGLLRAGKPAPLDLIAERHRAYVWISLPRMRYVTLAGDDALAWRPDLDGEAPRREDDLLRGQPAFAGKARGRAVIVRAIADLDRVRRGDVLVAPATNIDFVPALHRAIALVTEEGGILCHAAIVSREMRIPAVIGVRRATRLLTSGELVEVDATCGIVRRVTETAPAKPS